MKKSRATQAKPEMYGLVQPVSFISPMPVHIRVVKLPVTYFGGKLPARMGHRVLVLQGVGQSSSTIGGYWPIQRRCLLVVNGSYIRFHMH
jgi:hypothetical protein